MSLEKRPKKLVLVLPTSTLVITARKETVKAYETVGVGEDDKMSKSNKYLENLARVPYIQYPITFWKDFLSMSAFFDLDSEVNAIYLTFIKELGLPIRLTDVGVQKIDSITLDTYEMVVAVFLVTKKAN